MLVEEISRLHQRRLQDEAVYSRLLNQARDQASASALRGRLGGRMIRAGGRLAGISVETCLEQPVRPTAVRV